MNRIVFLDSATIGSTVNMIRPRVQHTWQEYEGSTGDQVAERLAGATIAITNKVPIRELVLDHLPDLRLIAVAATGYDCVDVSACDERGVAVINVRGYAVDTLPEHTFALILALRRSLCAYREAVLRGRWQQAQRFCFFDYPIHELAGSTIGIIGAGSSGTRVAEIARAFGMRVLVAGRKGASELPPDRVPFEQVLEEADIITVHCPLTPETRGLIGMDAFRAMAKRPLLINTARGFIVDEQALEQALEEGLISGAAIDVGEQEPPPVDSPLMRIAARDDVIVTPHVAWGSTEAMQTLWNQLMSHIEAFDARRDAPYIVPPPEKPV